jgi:hypothetical protein
MLPVWLTDIKSTFRRKSDRGSVYWVVMCKYQRSIVLACAALAAGGCGGREAEESRTVLVETADSQSLQELQSKVETSAFRTLANSRSAVLEVKPSELVELQKLGLEHFDVSIGPQLDVLPMPRPEEAPLTAAQTSVLATLTRGLDPSEFLVTGERPLELSRDILSDQSLTLGVQLPGQRSVRVVSREARREADLLIWQAALEGGGEARIVSDSQGLSGIIRQPGGTYSVESIGDGRQVIIRERADRFRDHPPPPAGEPVKPRPVGPPPDAARCGDPSDEVRVLFAYSETLATAARSISRETKLAIDETNGTFKKSHILLRIVSAGEIRVNYQEDASLPFQRHYAVLVDQTDGVADELPRVRNHLGADLVVLLVSDERWCGDSGTIYPPADKAYAVTALSCAAPHLSLAHEIGHLAGARHDDDAENNPYAFGHGHINVTHQWRTIMASDKQCRTCGRIPHWSNPQVRYPPIGLAAPTGVAGVSEEARVLTVEAPRLATYRCGRGT